MSIHLVNHYASIEKSTTDECAEKLGKEVKSCVAKIVRKYKNSEMNDKRRCCSSWDTVDCTTKNAKDHKCTGLQLDLYKISYVKQINQIFNCVEYPYGSDRCHSMI